MEIKLLQVISSSPSSHILIFTRPFNNLFNFLGSNIGGIKETQEMLDFCAEKGIVSDIEIISANQIDEAYERTVKADVKYRFVIDINTCM
jgi:alcohol dehydrogenase (NADP+)